jgi:hypothetical protein
MVAFKELLALRKAAAQTLTKMDAWKPVLANLKGRVGSDGIERVATEAALDALGLARHERNPDAAKRLRGLMLELGWVAVRATHVTARGRAARVRGYARQTKRTRTISERGAPSPRQS